MEFARTLLLRVDRNAHRARGALGFGVSSQQQVYDLSIPLKDGVGIIVTCAVENRTINVLDSAADVFATLLDDAEKQAFNSASFCLFPIPVMDQVEFVVFTENLDCTPVEDDQVRSVESFITQAAMALERFRLRQMVDGKKPAADVDSLITVAFNK